MTPGRYGSGHLAMITARVVAAGLQEGRAAL